MNGPTDRHDLGTALGAQLLEEFHRFECAIAAIAVALPPELVEPFTDHALKNCWSTTPAARAALRLQGFTRRSADASARALSANWTSCRASPVKAALQVPSC